MMNLPPPITRRITDYTYSDKDVINY